MSVLELLRRLEAKGLPLSIHERSGEVETPTKGQWLIIGCVVEYMRGLGFAFRIEAFTVSIECHFSRGGWVQGRASSSEPVEAVLTAADKALS